MASATDSAGEKPPRLLVSVAVHAGGGIVAGMVMWVVLLLLDIYWVRYLDACGERLFSASLWNHLDYWSPLDQAFWRIVDSRLPELYVAAAPCGAVFGVLTGSIDRVLTFDGRGQVRDGAIAWAALCGLLATMPMLIGASPQRTVLVWPAGIFAGLAYGATLGAVVTLLERWRRRRLEANERTPNAG